jgi:ribose transport system ATP-binding protein
MGENGAGKSTLVKILSGVLSTYEGAIYVGGNVVQFSNPSEAEASGIAIMHQELSLIPEMSVAENVTLGHEPLRGGVMIDRKAAARRTEKLLTKFGFSLSPNTPINQLRVGEQQLVEIVRALSLDAKLLIMDEPTSALSQAETEVLMEVIRDLALQGVCILYISHRMDEVFEIADRITVLRDGNHIGTKLASDIDRGEVIEMMVGRKIEGIDIERAKPATSDVALAVKGIVLEDDQSGGEKTRRRLLDDVSLSVKRGEILGITGLLGAGRTELLETIFGARSGVKAGEISIDDKQAHIDSPVSAMRNGIALITEDRKNTGLLLDSSIAENIALPSLADWSIGGIPASGRLARETREAIAKLNIRCQGPQHRVGELSGGNQQKVVLGKWLATEPRILLLDEPTRGIDIGAKDEIYQLIGKLADQGLAIVMASSEIPELMSVCDRLVVLCEGRKTGEIAKADFSEELIKEMSMQFFVTPTQKPEEGRRDGGS